MVLRPLYNGVSVDVPGLVHVDLPVSAEPCCGAQCTRMVWTVVGPDASRIVKGGCGSEWGGISTKTRTYSSSAGSISSTEPKWSSTVLVFLFEVRLVMRGVVLLPSAGRTSGSANPAHCVLRLGHLSRGTCQRMA